MKLDLLCWSMPACNSCTCMALKASTNFPIVLLMWSRSEFLVQEKQIVAEELKEKERAKDLEKREKARCSKLRDKVEGTVPTGFLTHGE